MKKASHNEIDTKTMITNDNFMKLGLGRWENRRGRGILHYFTIVPMVVRILTREMGYT